MKYSESELLKFVEEHIGRVRNVKFTLEPKVVNYPFHLRLYETFYTEDIDDYGHSYEMHSDIAIMELYLEKFDFDITRNELKGNFYLGYLEDLKEKKK